MISHAVAALIGFATGLSLIVAIGAQNAFVLRQGLLKRHIFWLCLFCATSDALLICLGVAGFGAISSEWPAFSSVMAVGGAMFLLAYGATRFHAAWIGNSHLAAQTSEQSLKRVLALAAAFTWLNPHVYLDTLGLVGAVSTQFESATEKTAFSSGAVTASFVFFFSLGYGARMLEPVMATPRAWQVLDTVIGLTMWALAVGLVVHVA